MSTASSDLRWTWRRRFSWLTVLTTVLLICWGGVVTSIGAGMAFPDWPTSLGSYNLLNPVDEWWTVPAYLAEHGHRLIASLVGMMTVILAAWTWWDDPRAWMRNLGIGAVILVIVQGVLGGLRVLWVSIDLAAAAFLRSAGGHDAVYHEDVAGGTRHSSDGGEQYAVAMAGVRRDRGHLFANCARSVAAAYRWGCFPRICGVSRHRRVRRSGARARGVRRGGEALR
jgi:hypothetical protein